MDYFEIPLYQVNQAFTIQLNSIAYNFKFVWRDSDLGGWYLDIGYPDGRALINGIQLTIGNNLLTPYQHKIKGVLFAATQEGDNPTYANFGTLTKLYWIPPQ